MTTSGYNVPLADTYDDEVASIKDSFNYEDCEVCGGDLDDHIIGPDALGHAHAYCKREMDDA